jgi:hypothetical protein
VRALSIWLKTEIFSGSGKFVHSVKVLWRGNRIRSVIKKLFDAAQHPDKIMSAALLDRRGGITSHVSCYGRASRPDPFLCAEHGNYGDDSGNNASLPIATGSSSARSVAQLIAKADVGLCSMSRYEPWQVST